MALLFGYSSSVQADDIDMDGNRIVDLSSPTSHTEPVTKYINHDVTKEMFQNNMHFYDDVCDKKFDIRLRKKRRWCPMQVNAWVYRIWKSVKRCGCYWFVSKVGAQL